MINLRILVFITLLFLIFNGLYSENNGKIAHFDDNFTIGIFSESGFLDINFKPDSNASSNPEYRSNPKNNLGISFSYKDYGFALSGSLIGIDNGFSKDESVYGETKTSALSFYYFSKKFGIDFYYKNYKGFYRLETKDVYSNLNVINAGVNFIYICADDFSFKAAFKQSERQTKSAATWLLSAGMGYSHIENDDSIIPDDVRSRYSKDSDFKKGDFYNVSLLIGGAATCTSNGYYFLTTSILFGLSPQFQDQDNAQSIHIGFKGNAKIALGYNGDKYYISITGQADAIVLRLKESEVSVINIDIGINAGYRF